MGQRYINGDFTLNPMGVLDLILLERRRELCFRGIRWEDLRRLNKEGGHIAVKERIVNNFVFKLEPKSKKYVWPIPESAVEIGHLEQNP